MSLSDKPLGEHKKGVKQHRYTGKKWRCRLNRKIVINIFVCVMYVYEIIRLFSLFFVDEYENDTKRHFYKTLLNAFNIISETGDFCGRHKSRLDPEIEAFWKHYEKRRKCWLPAFSRFPTKFSTVSHQTPIFKTCLVYSLQILEQFWPLQNFDFR